jgi:hypothetical protein
MVDHNLRLSAYLREIADHPEAACGMAELVGASVAIPFVSVLVGTLADRRNGDIVTPLWVIAR